MGLYRPKKNSVGYSFIEVPQGRALGPLFFIIYIHFLDIDIAS